MLDIILHSRLFKTMRLYALTNMVKKAVPFVLIPVLTMYLTPADYAQLSIFVLCAHLCVMLFAAGMPPSILLEYQDRDRDEWERYTTTLSLLLLGVAGVLSTLIFLGRDWVLGLFKIPEQWLWAVFVIAIGTNMVTVLATRFQALDAGRAFMALMLGFMVLEISISLYLIVIEGRHWEGRALGMMLASAVALLVCLVHLGRKALRGGVFETKAAQSALLFGLPLLPHSLGTAFMTMSDRLLLDHMVEREALGIYAIAFQLAMAVTLAAQTFHLAWAPWLYERLRAADRDLLIVRLFYLGFVAWLIGGAVFGVCSWAVFEFLIDPAYRDGFIPAWILSVAFSLAAIQLMLSAILTYQRKTGLISLITVCAGLVNIAVSFLLIQTMGAVGAAWGSLIANSLFLCLTFVIVVKSYPLPWKRGLRYG